jgi:hypothetical protein
MVRLSLEVVSEIYLSMNQFAADRLGPDTLAPKVLSPKNVKNVQATPMALRYLSGHDQMLP